VSSMHRQRMNRDEQYREWRCLDGVLSRELWFSLMDRIEANKETITHISSLTAFISWRADPLPIYRLRCEGVTGERAGRLRGKRRRAARGVGR